LPLVQPCQ